MRYTTIIDISENERIYRNHNARLLYVHMVLKSGYHADDRDIYVKSLRNMAADCGISIAACRHALRLLIGEGLVKQTGNAWTITKFVLEQPIGKRAKSVKEQKQRNAAAARSAEEAAREAQIEKDKKEREEVFQSGKTDFMIYYERQLEKARAGDEEAARIVEKNKAVYEAHKKQFENNQDKK